MNTRMNALPVFHAEAGRGGAEAGGGRQVLPLGEAKDQARPESVAAAGWFHGFGHGHGRDMHGLAAVFLNKAALFAQGGDDAVGEFEQIIFVAVQGVADEFNFVVVADEQAGAGNGREQGFAGQGRNLLSGVENIGHLGLFVAQGQLVHIGHVARAHNGHVVGAEVGGEGVAAGKIHGRRAEAVDLVAAVVGDDVRPGREFLFHFADAFQGQPPTQQLAGVIMKIPAHRSQDGGLLPQEVHGIGDVAGCAAAFFHNFVNEKGYAQNMQLFRQDVVCKIARKIHDPIVGQRSGNK